MSRRSSLLSLSFMYFDKMGSCAGKTRREFSYIYIFEIEFIQSKLTYMLSLQIQPSDTGCSIFILPSNAMNRDIQIRLSNSTISRAHNSKAIAHQSKIRYRCSHKCIHPWLSPQEKSPASNTKIVITK
jgi:hypothetical protein